MINTITSNPYTMPSKDYIINIAKKKYIMKVNLRNNISSILNNNMSIKDSGT